MFNIVKEWTRSGPGISFMLMSDPEVPLDVKNYWANAYKATNKCISVVLEETDTTLTANETWESEQAYNDYHTDPFMVANLFTERENHYIANGITMQIISQGTV